MNKYELLSEVNEFWNLLILLFSGQYILTVVFASMLGQCIKDMVFCGPAGDTLLSSQKIEKLNFDTNYIAS